MKKLLVIIVIIFTVAGCDMSKDHVKPDLTTKYYRLKVVNKDGTVEYSKIIADVNE